MPEPRDLPLFRWGEEIRRSRAARHAARRRAFAAAGCIILVGALASTLLWPPRPLLLWNASTSSPVGLYRVGPAEGAEVGEMVVAWPPEHVRRLAAERRYLPLNVPLVKRVAAAVGDQVCAAGEALFVNGRLETLRRTADPSGRPLPWWTGCERIEGGDLFLLTPGVGDAFDGRYFGVTREERVVGRARLIWRG
jgi:conjugative transfer signal peptidase TraF